MTTPQANMHQRREVILFAILFHLDEERWVTQTELLRRAWKGEALGLSWFNSHKNWYVQKKLIEVKEPGDLIHSSPARYRLTDAGRTFAFKELEIRYDPALLT